VTAANPSCAEVRSLAAELALGVVSGTERAGALAHLGGCADCRGTVEQLAPVADGLLLLAPPAEPEIGFEAKVLAAIGEAGPQPRPAAGLRRVPARVARSVAAVAAAVVLVAAGVAAGVGLSAGGRDDGTVRTAVALGAGGRATCRALVHEGDPAWLYVSLEAPPEWTGEYAVELVATGRPHGPRQLGSFRLQAGRGGIGAALDVPAERVEAIRVYDAEGTLRYEARFDRA
jgi:hypothetical protein